MRSLKASVLLLCMVFAISQATGPCPLNPCNSTDCCLRESDSDPAECSPYLPLNAHCMEYNMLKNHVYILSCPCQLGLFCVNGKCGQFVRTIPRTTTPAITEPDLQ